MEHGQEFINRRRAEKLIAYYAIKCDATDRLATLQDLHDHDPDDRHSADVHARLRATISFINQQIKILQVESAT